MLSSRTELAEILGLAPDWKPVLDSLTDGVSKNLDKGAVTPYAFFEKLGARSIYLKCLSLGKERELLVRILRDSYYQPMLARMLSSNQSLKRFWAQRKHPADFQKSQAVSMAVELAAKMEGVLKRHLDGGSEDGFKVLLPAYVQRSVHNAAVDYIKEEWQWEKETLQDLNLDPEQEDPRQSTADDIKYAPENQAISREQVSQLNQLRAELKEMLDAGTTEAQREPLVVVDLIFGLALTEKSKSGQELTMREVCEVLSIAGETQARKIARCQVLLDKGLDMIRNRVRSKLPGVAQCWQSDININTASRRELSHQLGLTEGEVDRLIAARQYYSLEELVERGALKANRLDELRENGAVASFVPVDINVCTTRDMIDILGLPKELAQKITSLRPFASFEEMEQRGLLDKSGLGSLIERGGAVRAVDKAGEGRLDINSAAGEALKALGLKQADCEKILRGRPFTTWGELEEYLTPDAATWQVVRQKTRLSLFPY